MKYLLFSFLLLIPGLMFSQWESCNNGLNNNLNITSLVTCGNYIFASTWQGDSLKGGIYRSNDNGDNWIEKNNGLPGRRIFGITICNKQSNTFGDHILSDPLIFAAVNYYVDNFNYGVYIYCSSDYGETWSLKKEFKRSSFDSYTSNDNIIAAISGKYIYISTDYGDTWKEKSTMTFNTSAMAIKGNTVIAGGYETGLYYSTNYGDSWSKYDYFEDNRFLSIYIDGNDIFVCTGGHFDDARNNWIRGGLYVSQDGGDNWDYTYGRYPDSTGHAASVIKISDLLVIGVYGTYTSKDLGKSFKIKREGLETKDFYAYINSFAYNDNYVFAGSGNGLGYPAGNGIYRTKLDYLTSVPDLPLTEFAVFPKPARDYIILNSINEESYCSILIYNSIGARVLKIENPGVNQLKVDVSALAPGIYFVVFQTDKDIKKEKFIISR